jgi:Zn-dependent peptidase ImmA (M78 family)
LDEKDSPTLRQLENLAKATLTPFGYFFLSEPPVDRLPIPHFRTIADTPFSRPSPDLLETVQMMERRQAWMREFLLEEGMDRLPFVGSVGINEDLNRVASTIRATLGFEQGWAAKQRTWEDALQILRNATEAVEILVVHNRIVGNNTHRKLDPEEFRGFVLVDEYAPLVFINGADGKAAQMFTLAHELAHIWYGASAAFDLREMRPADDPTEQACNKVAAEFLVPEAELRQIWSSIKQDIEPFQSIARHFKVSALVGARRALDLQLINKKTFFDFYQVYMEDERRVKPKIKGGNFYFNQNYRVGRRFAETVVRAVKEGKLLYNEAYRLTGLYGKTFDTYIHQYLNFEISR